MTDLQYLGPALGILRRLRGMDESQVALRMGSKSKVITGYESGEITPSVISLAKLLDLFDCDLSALQVAIEVARETRPLSALKRELSPGSSSFGPAFAEAALCLAVRACDVLSRNGEGRSVAFGTESGRGDLE